MSRLSLPADVLDKMTCLNCKHPLSVFPVYVKKDETGGVCGRCKPKDEDQYFRDEAYESLAQFLLFPCIYKEHGCPKYLVPSLVEEHEPCCEFRKFRCPSSIYNDCKWEGPKATLYLHFEEKHPSLLINEQQFEIDFLTSTEAKMLMKVEEELFVVNKDIDARKEILNCSVEYLKSQENDESYNYHLRILSDNLNYFHKCQDRMADGQDPTKLTANFLRDKLHDPTSMICKIEVFKVNMELEEQGNETKEATEKNPNLDWQMLAELECPVCYDYMLPPIYQCRTGHSICKNCRPRVKNSCPSCKQEIGTTQNFTLAKMTQYINYPCKHHKLGCRFASKATDIEAHEASCEFGPFRCPLEAEQTCTWSGSVTELQGHVQSIHNATILKTDRVEVNFNEATNSVNLLIFNNRVFKLTYRHRDSFCVWGMQMAGSLKDTKMYKFEIDVFDSTGGKKRFLISGPVVPLTTSINDRNCCIKLADATLSLYTDDKLVYLIRVGKE